LDNFVGHSYPKPSSILVESVNCTKGHFLSQRWRKLGRVFGGEAQFPWMASHAQVPFAERIEGDLYRIYFTSRDAQNRSHIGWLEFDITRPDRILRLAEAPLLAPGTPGSFDDCGAMMSWMVCHGSQRYLYYIGWNTRATVPFHVSIGLAVGPEAAGIPAFSALPRGGRSSNATL
jgi:hypothetical protein